MTERFILHDLRKCIKDTHPLTDSEIDIIANREVANFGCWYEKFGKFQVHCAITNNHQDCLLRQDNCNTNRFASKVFGFGRNWNNMLYVDANCPVMLANKNRIAGAIQNKIEIYCKTHPEIEKCEFTNIRCDDFAKVFGFPTYDAYAVHARLHSKF